MSSRYTRSPSSVYNHLRVSDDGPITLLDFLKALEQTSDLCTSALVRSDWGCGFIQDMIEQNDDPMDIIRELDNFRALLSAVREHEESTIKTLRALIRSLE